MTVKNLFFHLFFFTHSPCKQLGDCWTVFIFVFLGSLACNAIQHNITWLTDVWWRPRWSLLVLELSSDEILLPRSSCFSGIAAGVKVLRHFSLLFSNLKNTQFFLIFSFHTKTSRLKLMIIYRLICWIKAQHLRLYSFNSVLVSTADSLAAKCPTSDCC